MKNEINILNRGFSTLFVVIIMGVLALALVFSLTTNSVWSIRSSIDTKNADIAKSMLNACSEVALEAIRENNSYTGSSNVTINSYTCAYTVSNLGGSSKNIQVSAILNNITRKSNIITGSFNPLTISSWQEI